MRTFVIQIAFAIACLVVPGTFSFTVPVRSMPVSEILSEHLDADQQESEVAHLGDHVADIDELDVTPHVVEEQNYGEEGENNMDTLSEAENYSNDNDELESSEYSVQDSDLADYDDLTDLENGEDLQLDEDYEDDLEHITNEFNEASPDFGDEEENSHLAYSESFNEASLDLGDEEENSPLAYSESFHEEPQDSYQTEAPHHRSRRSVKSKDRNMLKSAGRAGLFRGSIHGSPLTGSIIHSQTRPDAYQRNGNSYYRPSYGSGPTYRF